MSPRYPKRLAWSVACMGLGLWGFVDDDHTICSAFSHNRSVNGGATDAARLARLFGTICAVKRVLLSATRPPEFVFEGIKYVFVLGHRRPSALATRIARFNFRKSYAIGLSALKRHLRRHQ